MDKLMREGENNMIYVMSDLHGCYDKYIQMLEKINFSEEDTLYVLGDVLDRGSDGITIMQDMMKRDNVIFFLGNHEKAAYGLLYCLFRQDADFDEDAFIPALRLWTEDGGDATLAQFLTLPAEEKKAIFNYILHALIHEEIEVNGKKFHLSHTVPEKEEMMNYDNLVPNDFLLGEPEYELEYYQDKYIVTGHTPTGFIDESYKGRIYQKNHHIAIDCGAVFGNPLGCIRLDDLAEFYV